MDDGTVVIDTTRQTPPNETEEPPVKWPAWERLLTVFPEEEETYRGCKGGRRRM